MNQREYYLQKIEELASTHSNITILKLDTGKSQIYTPAKPPRVKRKPTRYTGIYRYGAASRYCAVIIMKGVKLHLGTFATAEEAARAYNQAAIKAGKTRLNQLTE